MQTEAGHGGRRVFAGLMSGGHSHGNLGYHYHAHMVNATSQQGNAYTLHILMKGAWKGLINDIPEFWDSARGEPAYSLSQRHRYVGKN
jgi:hypothetical protein